MFKSNCTEIKKLSSVLVHRNIINLASKYLCALSDNSPIEHDRRVLEIDDIDGDILKTIVYFCYKPNAIIDEGIVDVDAVVIAAANLRIPILEGQCIRYYKNIMRPSNCLGIWTFAKQFNVVNLAKWSEAFIHRKFKDVAMTEGFLQLTEKQLDLILKSSQLNVNHEEDVFNALIRWINHDRKKRKVSFKRLFANIRLNHVQKKVS